MSNYVSVGKVLNFHGIHGEAKVGFTKNQEDFLLKLKSVFIKLNDEYTPIKIKSVRFNKQFALIKFEGVNSIDAIIQYKDCLLFVEEETIRENLEEDEYLIDELTGADVYSNEEHVGVVVGVSNNGANDLLSVRGASNKISLVPLVKAIVLNVDIKNKKIIIKHIEGLIE